LQAVLDYFDKSIPVPIVSELAAFLLQNVANSGPEILCQTLKITLGTAASGEK